MSSSLVVENFVAGLMLKEPAWKRELEFAASYKTIEPWLKHAIDNAGIDIAHASLTRSSDSVSENTPIKFNKEVFTSWEALRDRDIKNYKGAVQHLSEKVIQSWIRSGVGKT